MGDQNLLYDITNGGVQPVLPVCCWIFLGVLTTSTGTDGWSSFQVLPQSTLRIDKQAVATRCIGISCSNKSKPWTCPTFLTCLLWATISIPPWRFCLTQCPLLSCSQTSLSDTANWHRSTTIPHLSTRDLDFLWVKLILAHAMRCSSPHRIHLHAGGLTFDCQIIHECSYRWLSDLRFGYRLPAFHLSWLHHHVHC